ncbi:MAG TPA: hypothetical protein VMM13_01505, partial [Euzebya sp.]|nr:hypothetical protein [Euzebya sp.]
MSDGHLLDTPALRRVWAVVGAIAVVAAVATTALDRDVPSTSTALIAVSLCAAAAVTERWAWLSVRFGAGTYNLTLSEVPLIIGVFLLPDAAVLLVLTRILGALVGLQVLRRQEGYKTVLHVVHRWCEALLAIAAFSLISPRDITDGGRVTLTVLALALVVTVVGAIATATAASAVSGRFCIDLVHRGIRDGLGPVLFTSSVAVISLVLAQASTALLWAPVAIIAMLHVIHQAHVRLLQANGEQHKVLELTRHITADADLPTTAAMICQATRLLLGASMAAMRIPRLDGRGHEWIGAAGEET